MIRVILGLIFRMERIRNTVLENIRMVGLLTSYPNHRLRILDTCSCVPRIEHETRSMQFVCRFATGDSRVVVLDAIERSVLIIKDCVSHGTEFHRDLKCLDTLFLRGLKTIAIRYENDIGVLSQVEYIGVLWSRTLCRISPEVPALDTSSLICIPRLVGTT